MNEEGNNYVKKIKRNQNIYGYFAHEERKVQTISTPIS